MLGALTAAVRSMMTRGKITAARVGPRTLLQVTGLNGEIQQWIELLLPPGYSARPVVASDVLLARINGTADHVVALGGDGATIADLAPGEFGLTDGTHLIVMRSDHIQIKAADKVRIESPRLECTGEIVAKCDGSYVTLSAHGHPSLNHAANPNT